jgi:hypothetical protein
MYSGCALLVLGVIWVMGDGHGGSSRFQAS